MRGHRGLFMPGTTARKAAGTWRSLHRCSWVLPHAQPLSSTIKSDFHWQCFVSSPEAFNNSNGTSKHHRTGGTRPSLEQCHEELQNSSPGNRFTGWKQRIQTNSLLQASILLGDVTGSSFSSGTDLGGVMVVQSPLGVAVQKSFRHGLCSCVWFGTSREKTCSHGLETIRIREIHCAAHILPRCRSTSCNVISTKSQQTNTNIFR